MAMHNFGVIKATFTNYLNESENIHAKDQFGKFMMMIKESKSLKLVFEVFRNIENKFIPSEPLAIKYLDENINLIKSSKLSPTLYLSEQKQIQRLLEGLKVRVSSVKEELYSHVDTIIMESTKSTGVNVDKLHESYVYVLDYIKNNKPRLAESALVGFDQVPKEFLVRRAIEKFNTKFSSLNESDKSIFKSIISTDTSEKQNVFESIKSETLTSLKSLTENSEFDYNTINESIKKINEMEFSLENYSNDVLKLHELKVGITQ